MVEPFPSPLPAGANARIRAFTWMVVLLLGLAYAYLGASTVLPDIGGDNAAYWLTAKAWSPWQAPSTLARDFAQASTYPPLYPLVLAWSGGSTSLLAAHAVTVALLLGGFVAIWRFARLAGLDDLAAAGICLGYGCLYSVRFEGLDLHSEPLYLLLSMLALGSALRLRARPTVASALMLGVFVAGALLARSCGVVLLVAVALTGLRERHRAWLAAVAPGVLAMAVNALLQHSQHRYVSEFIARYAVTDPMLAMLENLRRVALAWAVAIGGPGLSSVSVWLLGGFGLLAVATACWRSWRGEVDGLYALGYFALVTAWPYPAETVRLFMPCLGLAFAQACLGARALAGARAAPPWRQLWWLPLCLAIPDALGFAGRLSVPMSPELTPYKRSTYWQEANVEHALIGIGLLRAVDQALAALPGQIPADQCVLSIKPSVVAALGNRTSKPPPLAEVDGPAFESALAATGCRYALLLAIKSPTYPSLLYPAARLTGRLHDIARYPNVSRPGQLAVVLAEILPATP